LEGLEERKLWSLYQDYVDDVKTKISNLVKVNEMYNLTDLTFKLEKDLDKMKMTIINNWDANKLK